MLATATLLAALPFASQAWAEQAQWAVVRNMRVEPTTPSAGFSAQAYFSLHNGGTEPVRLVGAATPLAKRIDIYEVTRRHGVRRGRMVEQGVVVPPGATRLFSRGDASLQLSEWLNMPRHWGKVPITPRFADGSETVVPAPLRR